MTSKTESHLIQLFNNQINLCKITPAGPVLIRRGIDRQTALNLGFDVTRVNQMFGQIRDWRRGC